MLCQFDKEVLPKHTKWVRSQFHWIVYIVVTCCGWHPLLSFAFRPLQTWGSLSTTRAWHIVWFGFLLFLDRRTGWSLGGPGGEREGTTTHKLGSPSPSDGTLLQCNWASNDNKLQCKKQRFGTTYIHFLQIHSVWVSEFFLVTATIFWQHHITGYLYLAIPWWSWSRLCTILECERLQNGEWRGSCVRWYPKPDHQSVILPHLKGIQGQP